MTDSVRNNELARNLCNNLQTLIDHWSSGLFMDTELITMAHGHTLGAVLDMIPPTPSEEGTLDENTGLRFWPAVVPDDLPAQVPLT